MNDKDTVLVSLRDIRKSFGAVKALQGVNIDLHAGEVLGLIGDNGAGKSTLMKVLAGTVIPDSGTITVNGNEVRFASPADAKQQHIGIVYQDLALCDTLDVAGNLYLGSEPRRGPFIDHQRMYRDAERQLAEFHVKVKSVRQLLAELSGGQRQSVAITRAVTFDPQILILDEPTAALAVAEVESVLKLITDVAARGVGVILITHRLQDLFRVADRVAVMYEGMSKETVPVDQLNLESMSALITREHIPTPGTGLTTPGTGASDAVAPQGSVGDERAGDERAGDEQ